VGEMRRKLCGESEQGWLFGAKNALVSVVVDDRGRGENFRRSRWRRTKITLSSQKKKQLIMRSREDSCV